MLEFSEKIPFRVIRGCYLLWKDGVVVYVGQSTNIFQRISTHSKSKKFDEYSYVEISEGNLDEIEADLIVQYNPILNSAMPHNSKYKAGDPTWGDIRDNAVPVMVHPTLGVYYKVEDFIKRERILISVWDEYGRSICGLCGYGESKEWRPAVKDAYCPRCGYKGKLEKVKVVVTDWNICYR